MARQSALSESKSGPLIDLDSCQDHVQPYHTVSTLYATRTQLTSDKNTKLEFHTSIPSRATRTGIPVKSYTRPVRVALTGKELHAPVSGYRRVPRTYLRRVTNRSFKKIRDRQPTATLSATHPTPCHTHSHTPRTDFVSLRVRHCHSTDIHAKVKVV